METDQKTCLIVLMHGDCQVSTKELARIIGVKTVTPASATLAEKHSGYQFGGTSPFSIRKKMPVYIERSILDLERIYINGGKRGFLVGLAPKDLAEHLGPQAVEVAIPG